MHVPAEQAAVVSLGVQLEESQQRGTALERQLEAMRQLPGQLAELQTAHEALRREAAQANGKAVAMQETIKGLRKSLEEEQFRSKRVQQQQLEALQKSDAGREDRVGSLRKQLEESQGDCRAMASEAEDDEMVELGAREMKALCFAKVKPDGGGSSSSNSNGATHAVGSGTGAGPAAGLSSPGSAAPSPSPQHGGKKGGKK